MIFFKNQLPYLKNLPIFSRVFFHYSNFGFGSNKRLVPLSNSCASFNKKCDLKSRSQQLELEPLILTLKIGYLRNISIIHLFVFWSLTFNLQKKIHLQTQKDPIPKLTKKPNLCVVPSGEFIYIFCVIGSCRWQCHSAQQSSRNVFGNSYVCAYFSFVFIC